MDVKIKDDKTLGQIYKDALQPTAKQIGEALEEVSKTARLLLAPLSLCGVGFDRFQKWCDRICNNVKEENIQSPTLNILIPTINGLSVNQDETLLGEMFFNILQNSADKTKQKILSPAFPKILEQLSQEEAKILTLIKTQGYMKFNYYFWVEKETNITKEEICEVENGNFNKEYFLAYWKHITFLPLIAQSTTKTENYFRSGNDFISYDSDEGKDILMQNKSNEYEKLQKYYATLTFTAFGKIFAEICISDKCKDFLKDIWILK